MDEIDLLSQITAIVNGAKEKGVKVEVSQTLDKYSYVIARKGLKKAVIIGKVEIEGVELIVGYSINVHKWKYFLTEGFSRDQIIDDMSSEVFEGIKMEEIPAYLSC